ncbi:MAG: hypothetical protein GF334_00005 [Candidatus Altiarchaeales archaeon]|nr:hypothetical protein [Candidatus Altiarchaeales archaeon]
MDTLSFVLVFLVLALMDVFYTYRNIGLLRRHRSDWIECEANPFVRFFWRRFGFSWGTFSAAAVTVFFVVFLALLIGGREFFQGLVIGVYVMLHHMHYLTYAGLRSRYLGEEPNLLARIFMDW